MDTITPLAHSLNLTIDTRSKRDDVDELVANIAALPEESVALVCWEHKVLSEQAEALGVHSPPVYPSDQFDWQWTVWNGTLAQDNEHC